MISSLRKRLSYSNVIASIALFIALGGAAIAAGLPKNSVGPTQLKRGAVKTRALARAAVTSGKLAPKSVVLGKLGPNSVGPGNIGNGAVTSAKIGGGAVIASSIKNGVVTTNKLQKEAVTTEKLANGSVTPAKLSSEIGGTVSTLKSGQTLRGVFYVNYEVVNPPKFGSDSISYQFPIAGNPPAVTVLKKGQTSANCTGIGSGSAPTATAGNLCVYLTEEVNLDETTPLAVANNQRLGFGLIAKSKAAGETVAAGQWAVTAP
jgi:trimeric autotransporter adhesin